MAGWFALVFQTQSDLPSSIGHMVQEEGRGEIGVALTGGSRDTERRAVGTAEEAERSELSVCI